MIKNRHSEVYDIETIASIFSYVGLNIDTEEIVKFVLHKDKFELIDFIQHLKTLKGQIGFNNLSFDYPIIHFIIKNHNEWLWSLEENKLSRQDIISLIYQEAQRIINNQNTEGFFSSIRDKDVLIPQLDLFKVWHYNNKARMTSLKALEISMNYPNVLDMPIEHTEANVNLNQIDEILEYNINDVLATYEFYKRSLDKISLRKQIKFKYGLSCINYSDSKIGESLLLELYSKQTKTNPWEIKKLRSNRPVINIKEILFDYIKFNSKEFNKILDFFNELVVRNGKTKDLFQENVIYKGFQYDYGVGGIHGCIESGVYSSDKDYVIIDADVASLYPSIAIKNKLYIDHLGETFIDLYDKDIVKERIAAKRAKNMAISDALKLSANSVYGKSNEATSFLYDPKYTMSTTINGQLLLSMLAEMLVDNLSNIIVLQINTDGITVKIHRSQVLIYYMICDLWQSITNLELEYVDYSKMIIRDVNNYIAVKLDGKAKYKGAFEIDKVVGNEPAYHKDNSFRIIPIALSDYFIKQIPIEETIFNHKNIYDFCGRQKFGRDSYGEIHSIINNQVVIDKQQKNVRYYISKSGKVFIKQYTKGTSEIINKGFQVEIFNKFVEKDFDDYKIDYSFYIKECKKIIDILEPKQMALF